MRLILGAERTPASSDDSEPMGSEFFMAPNVNPGLIIPWLINRGCPLLVGIHHCWREHPPNSGTGLLILGQH